MLEFPDSHAENENIYANHPPARNYREPHNSMRSDDGENLYEEALAVVPDKEPDCEANGELYAMVNKHRTHEDAIGLRNSTGDATVIVENSVYGDY